MTENKRFELIPMSNKGDIWYGLFDNFENEYVIDKLCEDSKKVCEKLNEIADENKQLKQRINIRLHFYCELYESTNDKAVKRVIRDLEDILKR